MGIYGLALQVNGRSEAMAIAEPTTELQPQFSSAAAVATPWTVAREQLERAEIYWLTGEPFGQTRWRLWR